MEITAMRDKRQEIDNHEEIERWGGRGVSEQERDSPNEGGCELRSAAPLRRERHTAREKNVNSLRGARETGKQHTIVGAIKARIREQEQGASNC